MNPTSPLLASLRRCLGQPGYQTVLGLALATVLIAGISQAQNEGEKSHKLTSVSLRKMADALHSVIVANRDVYVRDVVQPLALEARRVPCTEDWRAQKGLPVHAQMQRAAGVAIQTRGAEFSYTLRSLEPLHPNNAPQTQVEQNALTQLTANPSTNVYTEETLGGRSYFTAVYADRATLPACVQCHNAHPNRPSRELRTNDVMGAVVVRIPLEF